MKSERVHKAVAVFEDKKLVLFLELAATAAASEGSAELRLDLRSAAKELGNSALELERAICSLLALWLPVYYQPDSIVVVPRMPLTKHDKVDKRHLMDLYRMRNALNRDGDVLQASYSDVCSMMHQLFKRHLAGMADRRDDWKTLTLPQLGGDSLIALRLAEDVRTTFDDIKLELLFDWLLHHTLIDVIEFVFDGLSKQDNALGSRVESELDRKRGTAAGINSDESDATRRKDLSSADQHSANLSSTEKRRLEVDERVSEKKRKIECFEMLTRDVNNRSLDKDNRRSTGDGTDSMEPFQGGSTIEGGCDTSVLCSIHRGSEFVYHSSLSEGLMPTRSVSAGFLPGMRLEFNWKYCTGKCVDASPLVAIQKNGEGVVYIGSHSHRFAALSLRTGAALWEVFLPDRIEGSACLSRCGNFVCFGCYDGSVYALNSLTGRLAWSHRTSSQVKSSPRSTDQGLLCVGSHDKHLHILDAKTRSCQEVDLSSGSVFASPCVDLRRGPVVVGTLGGVLSAVCPESGSILWKYDVGKPLFSSAVATEFGYCVGCVDHRVYGFSPAGQLMWSYETAGPIFSTACRTMLTLVNPVSDIQAETKATRLRVCEVIIVGSHDHSLYCLAAADGALLWKTRLGSPVYATPFCFSVPTDLGPDSSLPVEIEISGLPHDKINNNPVPQDGCNNESSKNGNINNTLSFGNKVELPEMDIKPVSHACSVKDALRRQSKSVEQTCKQRQHVKSCAISETMDVVRTEETFESILNYVAVGCTSGTVYILSARNGAILTEYRLGGELFSSPVVVNDKLVVGCRDNNVYCLKLTQSNA